MTDTNDLYEKIEQLQAEVKELRELITGLDRIVPRKPCAITWEQGVEILNFIQDKFLPKATSVLGCAK